MTAQVTSGSETDNLLGFDFGSKRIGVAVGNALTGTARGLTTIRNGAQPDWPGLQALFEEWRPAACVVGLPLNLDGSEQPLTGASRRFGAELTRRFGVPVHSMDERLSSVEARDTLRAQRAAGRRRRIQPGDKDIEAARIILEDWLGTQAGGQE